MTKKRICNVCGSEQLSLLANKNGHSVFQCKSCGLAFTHPQPESIVEQYDSSYFDLYRCRRAFRLKRADARLRAIELIREPGRILDIGCSLGYFVEAANARGWQGAGIEISPYASEEARQLGLDVRMGVLEDADYPDASFDCVTMWDVIEHVSDPTKHMIEVSRILADDALIVIGTPNLGHVRFKMKRGKWRHLKPAEHIFYFQKSSISALLKKTGFDVVYPPVFGGRSFAGSLGASVRCAISRFVQFNDVLTVYGVKR
ncbi:MAG: class I SAM-dependent methyltransferase [Armatimonadetes bacterium]|nr:class I SAM-dependent methyltransferase [Armatimonadota bacterium]